MNDLVLVNIADRVATITLNRPDRMNAVDTEMGLQLEQVFREVGLNDEVRAVVLTGAGRGFCAGADMGRLDGLVSSKGQTLDTPAPGDPHPVLDVFEDSPPEYRSRYAAPGAIPKPVIAAVNGACAGVGLVLAMSSDIRFGGTKAMFCAAFSHRGLTAEGGLGFSLQAATNSGAAADMLLSGRKVYAEEAYRMGLISRLVDADLLVAEAQSYARELVEKASPRSMRVIKRQMQAARGQTFLEASKRAYKEVVASLKSSDFSEGVASFREKRAPNFTGE